MINVETLKKKVLDLAMRGKLVPQDANDEPASVLIEKIKAEKDELIKAKKIKKTKALPPIEPDEIPYQIPDSWEWVRLDEILALKNGAIRRGPFGSTLKKSFFVPKSDNTYKVYEQGNAINKTIEYGNYYITEEKYHELKSFQITPGDIIISGAGTIGKTFELPINAPKGVINQALIRLTINTNIIRKDFFLEIFKQKMDFLTNSAKGTAIKNMASIKFIRKNLLWPLPPLAEQKRIVTKIEEIFAELDKIESASNEYDKCKELLNKRVLDLAMRGKLVPQDANDEPASVLIEKIKAEKDELIKAKKIKKTKALPPIEPDEIPYQIPDSWEWVKLNDISNIIMGQSPKGSLVFKGKPNDELYEFHQGKSYFGNKYLEKSPKVTKISNRLIETNVIVMSVRAPVGDVNLTTSKIAIGRGLAGIKPIKVDTTFLYYLLKTQKSGLLKKATGTTFKAINTSTVKNILCPIPPLAEQKRIVAKIEEIQAQLKEK